jgi:hypothetical protein
MQQQYQATSSCSNFQKFKSFKGLDVTELTLRSQRTSP